MLKIILSQKECLGPCFGIKRALTKCLTLQNKKRWVIYGKLGHNQALNDLLQKQGLKIIKNIKKIKDKKVVIRAHGINRKDLQYLITNKIKFLDLTCPFVKHSIDKSLEFEKKGYQVIFIGDKHHIEMKNICSFLDHPLVVKDRTSARRLPNLDKVAVLTQTTETQANIDQALPLIKKKCKRMIYIPTRCIETEKRQSQTVQLARKVDLLLVIGDKISRNANNLLNLGRKITRTELVPSSRTINKNWLKGITKIGLIASASTPSFVVKETIEYLKWLDKRTRI